MKARCPSSGVWDYSFDPIAAEALPELATRLRASQPAWQSQGLEGRIPVLRRFAEQLRHRRDAIEAALVADTGRQPLSTIETDGLFQKIERDSAKAAALLESRRRQRETMEPFTAEPVLTPYPLVGVISPWNFPVSLSFLDTFQALLMGCAVIVKPSEVTPRFVAPIAEAISATAGLREVFAFVRGGPEVGQALIHTVDYICFTGSVATGRKVFAEAGKAFIPASMELGGKDPAIVLDDADIERTAASVMLGATLASGQICTSLERVYVHRSVHDPFVAALKRYAGRCKLSCDDPVGVLVPFIHAPQAEVFKAHVADATAHGADLICGGDIVERGGLWPTATVLTNVTHQMRVMREESFAPILPVMAFDTDEQAIALANDSRYGLSAVIYGRDTSRARRIGRRITCGATSLNMSRAHIRLRRFEQQPFGASGIGASRVGDSGFLRFCRQSALIRGEQDDVATVERAQIDAAFGS